MNKPARKIIPSPLTVVANEITKNELITSFLLDERNKVNPEEINSKYRGSVMPKNEFIINLGSKATSDAPITANFLATNFLHKKYTGIVIEIDITTDSIF